MYFFFSSRRRHTRFDCDWSSDVCSSDLFPDPDLLPLAITAEWKSQVAASMPELPALRRAAYRAMGASAQDAALLVESREKSDYFDGLVEGAGAAVKKSAVHWVNGELSALMNESGATFAQPPLPAASLRTILERIEDGTISGKAGKE